MSLGYLLASLPMLYPDRAPQVTVEAFVSACESAVGAEDALAAALLARNDPRPSRHRYVLAWRDFENAIDGAIGRRRIAKRGTGAADFVPPETSLYPVGLVRAIDAAFESAPDPLAREEALLRVRWAAAEEMGGADPHARSQLFAYAAKLSMTAARAARDTEKGRVRLDAALPQQTL
ncbi:MAG: hypothetical protein RR268_00230 [Kiritimatiellia bacterium]